MTLLLAMFLATEPTPTTVDAEMFDFSTADIGLNWDCERDRGRDKLRLEYRMGTEGSVPFFTRTIAHQPPKVVVDCSAEVYAYGETSLTMSSGWCLNEWGLEVRLSDGDKDRATANLRLGQEWLNGYQCRRFKE